MKVAILLVSALVSPAVASSSTLDDKVVKDSTRMLLRKERGGLRKGDRIKDFRTIPTQSSKCPLDCPCCNAQEWPEFVAAVEGYGGSPDNCFVRVDETSEIVALNLCETSTLTGFESSITGYMSMDYEFRGGTANNPVYYCGDSGSDIHLLTEVEGAVCREALEKRVEEENGICDNVFECST
mmetsp:Transcript_11210/g.21359  ORF Transcript_11210/g.21359 Transcript_11210/m.21359 type:complete len:182 (-) Transcript_11210:135-680(-)